MYHCNNKNHITILNQWDVGFRMIEGVGLSLKRDIINIFNLTYQIDLNLKIYVWINRWIIIRWNQIFNW